MKMNDIYDIAIIGGGPAGLTAGLYAARARLKVLLLERMGFGGQLLTYEKVDNYPGFPEGIGAFGLSELISAQALKFGLVTRNAEVTDLLVNEPIKVVRLADAELLAKTVVIASGASPNKLGVRGESEYTGRGVSYCAVCDAPFYRNQEVAVVGGGDTAIEEAIYLTKFASRVHVIHRRDQLRATRIIQERALQNDRISFILSSVVTEIKGSGEQGVDRLTIREAKGTKTNELAVNGVFVFVGIQPNSGFVPTEVDRDVFGFIRTDQEMKTSVPGVFAAGDVRVKELRQIVTAVGDGATAAFNAGRHIESHL
ncbi:MAG TPA: thioredoxin-disulfide reductase [Syntrophobacter fumaroxidans]|nr:thioredoxin-disulfide reductase [Syntrophobacter fumaroxidans]